MNNQHGNISLKRFHKLIKKRNRIVLRERGWVALKELLDARLSEYFERLSEYSPKLGNKNRKEKKKCNLARNVF